MNKQIKQRIKQIKNGEVPYGYKKTKIGIVPNEWKEFYLEDLFNVIDGDRGEKYPSKDEIFDSGYCVFLNAKNITKNGFDFNHIQYISEEKDKELRNGKLEKFDIVLTTRGTIGNVALNDNIKYENLRINSGMVLLRSENLKYIKYVYMYMKSKLFIHQVDKISFGSAQPQLTVKEIKKFKVVIPINETEQQKIADILSTQDKVIELKVKLLKEKEKQKKYLMQNLLTGKKRLKGFEGEWEEKLICDVFKITRGNVLAISLIRVQQDEEYIYPVYSSQTKNNGLLGYYNQSLYENAITWTTDGANAGFVAYREGKFYCTNVCGVLLDDKGNANECIAQILNSKTKYYVSYVGNPKLMNSVMAEIKIKFPPLEEQKAISEILTTADKELKLLQEELEEEKRKKKALMQLLLTGIVRVKV